MMRVVFGLVDLPTDLFLMVTSALSSFDVLKCRYVSKSWHREFTDDSLLREVLIREHLYAHEVRLLVAADFINPRPRADTMREIFDRVVMRYRALKTGRPFQVSKKKTVTLMPLPGQIPEYARERLDTQPYHPFKVPEWHRYFQPPSAELHAGIPVDLPEPGWTYDSGLLVYADAGIGAYVVFDIGADSTSIVPFDTNYRVVRRVRLKERVLVIEWAEAKPYHQINSIEHVHRHFVSAFDMVPVLQEFPWLPRWNAILRFEWRLHYLGFPLLGNDIWLSSHSATHFAAYIWQRNRSAWGEDEPIESLAVWDISRGSNYRPLAEPMDKSQKIEGPQLVKHLSFPDLDFLTLRQRDTPVLRRIEVEGDSCIYFYEEGSLHECGFNVADQRWIQPPVKYWERVTGLPLVGLGPSWEDRCNDTTPDICQRLEKVYSKDCEGKSPHWATCWRYFEIFPGIRNQVIRDTSAGISFSAEHDIDCNLSYRVASQIDCWITTLKLPGLDSGSCRKSDGNERWFITQDKDTLCIFHFDKQIGTLKGQPLHYNKPAKK